jgi:hypothetical protein
MMSAVAFCLTMPAPASQLSGHHPRVTRHFSPSQIAWSVCEGEPQGLCLTHKNPVSGIDGNGLSHT